MKWFFLAMKAGLNLAPPGAVAMLFGMMRGREELNRTQPWRP
jgi:hypothetical protein